MTIASTTRKAGPLLGTGSQTAWPFTFKVFTASDIAVTIVNSAGVETALVLNTNYSVALNANQETSPGGTVTYPITGTALPVGSKLSIIGNLAYDQALDIPSGGNFSPLALENQLDRAAMQMQQLKEMVDRAAVLPVTSSVSVAALTADILRLADSADNIDTAVANITAITTVADDLNEPVSEINTVAVNITNVNTVGTNINSVNTVATNIASINAASTSATNAAASASSAATSATNAANSATSASTSASTATTQAGIATTKAGEASTSASSASTSASSASTSATNAAASATSAASYVGNVINNPILGDDVFSGNASTTAFTLSRSVTASTETALLVTISGVVQAPTTAYTASGTTLTFTSAPPAGTNNIRVRYIGALAVNSAAALTAATSATTSATNAGASATSAAASAASAGSAEIVYVIDGGGSVLLAGSKGHIEIPFNCTIDRWTLLGDVAGSVTVDIKKSTFANFPTTTSITASATPALSTAQKAQSSALTGWTTSVSAGDILEFVVTGTPVTLTRAVLSLKVTRI